MPVRRLPDGRVPVLLSAHEADLISRDAAAILNYIERCEESEDLTATVVATLLRTRRVRRYRALVRAADRAELLAGLGALADGDQHPLVTTSSATTAPRTAFVFPGQGNQWPSMGADAYRQLPVYRAEADRFAEAFTAAGLPSPLPYLVAGDPAGQVWSLLRIQGAQLIHAASLAQVWRSHGIVPDITLGHSLGEVAAAYVAGSITLPDAVAVVAARATVVDRLAGHYGMAVLGVGIDDAEQFIAETAGWLEISAVNAPTSTVVSGDGDAVSAVVRLVEQRGVFARAIAVDYPGHTSALEPLRGTFEELLPRSAFLDAPVEFVSSACGAVVGAETDFTDYWCQNLCNTVRFDHAVALARQCGAAAFVELSAHPSLLSALTDLIDDESAVIVGSGTRGESITDELSANIAAAALADPGYRWAGVAKVAGHPPLRGFPNAPMRAMHLWATPEPLIDDTSSAGSDLTVAFEEWEQDTNPAPNTEIPCGIAIVAVPENPLGKALEDTLVAHRGCRRAQPGTAEIVVMIAPALQNPDIAVAVDDIVRGARLPDYTAVIGPHCRRVWLITVGGERLDPTEPVALPAQAALAAMHRSIGFEFPDQTFGHLDLPSWDIDAQTARAAVDVLLADAAEVALRGSGSGLYRCVRTLRERRTPAPERPLDPAALDNVVVTGGSGTIGQRFARHCIERGARRIIMLSRKGLDQDELDRLTAGHAAQVHAPPCDITDPDALSAVAAEHAGDGASLLIHAAGTARFGPHDQLTDADLADVFGAKVNGLARLTDIWPLRQGVRILMCSSVSGVWGGYGHAGYAASNRMLDVLAAQLRAKGLDCTAVRWGLWQGTEIAAADEITRIERSGLVAMGPDAAISASLCRHDGDPLIFAADFDRLRAFFESQGNPMLFTATPRAGEPDTVSDGSGGRPVAEVVRAELARVLSLGGPAAVDLSAALVDLGVDSLLALDLRKRLRFATGGSVPLARLLGGITGAELIDALQSSQGRLESSRD